jgi:hypothetical protein
MLCRCSWSDDGRRFDPAKHGTRRQLGRELAREV